MAEGGGGASTGGEGYCRKYTGGVADPSRSLHPIKYASCGEGDGSG